MVSLKTGVAYLLFALIATAAFLYLLFPAEAIRTYVDGRLAALAPSLTVQTAAIRPTLPLGVRLIGMQVHQKALPLIHIDDLRIVPDFRSLWQANPQLRFTATLADGTLMGRATIDQGGGGDLAAEADLAEIRLERIEGIRDNQRFTLSGILKGHLVHEGGPGTTNALLTVAGMRIGLKEAFFGITELVMEQTEADFSITGQTLRLKQLAFDGPLMEGKINGTIDLRDPLGKSRLNLSGNAKPRPELIGRLQETLPQGIVNARTLGTRGLTFRVRGSFDTPDLSMR